MASKIGVSVSSVVADASLAKSKRRGGHNRRADVLRKPNGRIDYSADRKHRSRLAEVAATRVRVHGLTKRAASSEKAGSALGRLYLCDELGEIGGGEAERMFEAGQEFARRRQAYLTAIAAPVAPRSGSELSGNGRSVAVDIETDPYIERATLARRRYGDITSIVDDACPRGLPALSCIIGEDREAPHLVPALRIALRQICRLLECKRKV